MQLIDSTALFNEALKLAWNKDKEDTAVFLELIQRQPIVTAERCGHWVPEYEEDGTLVCFHCSECDKDGRKVSNVAATHYCPDCGAKMDVFNRWVKKIT